MQDEFRDRWLDLGDMSMDGEDERDELVVFMLMQCLLFIELTI
jgi:hypothetical protein